MVDHVKVLGYKVTFAKAVVFVITLFFFFWIVPVDGFEIIRQLDFESVVIGIWLIVAGLWFTIEGLASMPETKRGTSKAGASILIGLGFVSFAFAFISMIGGVDILYESPELRTMTTILFGGAGILFFITLIPEVVHRESFVRALAKQFG